MKKTLDNSHSFNTSLAAEVGVEKALLLGHIEFWVKHNTRTKTNFFSGAYWMRYSLEQFKENFIYLNPKSISRWLNQLEDEGWIKIGKFSKDKIDQTNFYTVGERLIEWLSFNGAETPKHTQNEKSISQNENCSISQNENCSISQNENCNIEKIQKEDTKEDTGRKEPSSLKNKKKLKADGMHLFKNSEFFDKDKFKSAFVNTDYQDYDLDFYHEAVLSWSESKGAMKKDWIATARNFILRDMRDGRVKVKQNKKNTDGKESFINQNEKVRNYLYEFFDCLSSTPQQIAIDNFLWELKLNDDLLRGAGFESFKSQFWYYRCYLLGHEGSKYTGKGMGSRVDLKSYIGSFERHHTDGFWNKENWQQIFNNEIAKIKNEYITA